MTLALLCLLVLTGTFARGDIQEPPYGPSGWKPSGASFLLPVRTEVTFQVDEPFPPLSPPRSSSQLEETDQQFRTFHGPTSTLSDRRLTVSPQFRVPTGAVPTGEAVNTRSQSPFIDRIGAPQNRVRTNPANQQDNQPFVHKSKSEVRPLQGLSQYDDRARPSNQNQSPFPKQYLPPLEANDGNASFADLSPPDDNNANYSTGFPDADLRYQASLTDSESARVNNQPLFPTNNAHVSDRPEPRPAQEYGVPSLAQNSPRIFFIVLPARQPTREANTQTQAIASRFTGDLPNQATLQRLPRRFL